jgi:C4-dicarboxylate-specific signal transduction histidine kinase
MSKVIIEDKMGGSISVRNVENGAMFTIRLDQSI